MYGGVATHIKDAPKEVGVKTPLEQAACSLSHTLQAKASSKVGSPPGVFFFSKWLIFERAWGHMPYIQLPW